MLDWTGQKLGNYRITRILGQGGFANVYLGQHTYLQTYAAIKVLQARLTGNDLQTFLNEARTVASLVHPHIVRVLEFGEEGQTPYLVMDYCPNNTLRQRHPKGTRLSLSESVAYAKQVAEALQYAHNNKIIHRDVKPENMLIGQNDAVLLSDFGIATISQSSRYSRHQDISGTIAYSAPEQLQGKAGPASDQYSLAVVLYEWLTGLLPYQGSFPEIASQHLLAPIPTIRDKVSSIPLAVEQVIQKALAKEPQQRFQSVHDFAVALELAEQGTLDATQLQAMQVDSQANVVTYLKTEPAASGMMPSPFVPSVSAHLYQPLQVPQSSQRKGTNRLSLVAIVLLALALLGVSARLFLGSSPGNTQNGQANSPSSAGQTGPSQASTPTATLAPTATSAPTATPIPTPAGKTISENITMACATTASISALSCTEMGVTVLLNTVVIDPAGTMTWNFTVTNLLNQAVSISVRIFPTYMYLEDSTGTDTQINGGTITTGADIGANQSLPMTAILPLMPTPGAPYYLHLSLQIDHDTDGSTGYPIYTTLQFKF